MIRAYAWPLLTCIQTHRFLLRRRRWPRALGGSAATGFVYVLAVCVRLGGGRKKWQHTPRVGQYVQLHRVKASHSSQSPKYPRIAFEKCISDDDDRFYSLRIKSGIVLEVSRDIVTDSLKSVHPRRLVMNSLCNSMASACCYTMRVAAHGAIRWVCCAKAHLLSVTSSLSRRAGTSLNTFHVTHYAIPRSQFLTSQHLRAKDRQLHP
jgi:hypothetical protein